MSSSLLKAAAGLMVVALAAACDSPTRPGDRTEARGNRLEIVGTTAVAPQQTAEVQAFLVGPSGGRQDVTARVRWTTSDPSVLALSAAGRVTGGAVGEVTLSAALDDLSASTNVIVVPAGTFRLAGMVRGSGSSIPLAGAQVQLVTASGDVMTTQAASSGAFRFYGVAGRARLRISRRAFHPYEAEIDIHDHLTHDVSLSAIALSGSYTLTLSASNRCRSELPEPTRTRIYAATIDQVESSLTVTLQGPDIFSGWNDKFTGMFVETNEVRFQFNVESLVGDYSAYGTMTTSISAAGLSGFMDGAVSVIVPNEGNRGSRLVSCAAADHAVVFSR